LSIRDLHIGIVRKRQTDEIVRGVNLDVQPGEKVGIVGESGSGKTLTMLSVLRLLASPPLAVLKGEVLFDGADLATLDEKRLREVRGGEIAMVYQDPMSSLNPLLRIGNQLEETLKAHGVASDAASERTKEVLVQVGLAEPDRVRNAFPHQLSGGMIQRVMIAMALATSPRLLIADEPTTALDVTIQRQILELVTSLQAQTHMAVLWVTHDLGVVASLVDRVVVMYAGRIVESATTSELFARPTHPYTKALLESLPGIETGHRSALHQIGGTPPDPTRLSGGCPFRVRCPYAIDKCEHEEPPLIDRGNASAAACWRDPSEW
jgi:oligopeptide/dipeptide ABC transporter ATP-binding protein